MVINVLLDFANPLYVTIGAQKYTMSICLSLVKEFFRRTFEKTLIFRQIGVKTRKCLSQCFSIIFIIFTVGYTLLGTMNLFFDYTLKLLIFKV